MAAQHLTDAIVRKLPRPARGAKVHYDVTAKGFGVSVTAGGAKSFVLNYRVRGTGRERRFTIGRAGAWSTVAAREEALRLRRMIDAGGDPLARLDAAAAAPTMGDLVARFIAEHVPRKRPKTQSEYLAMVERYIAPHFGRHAKMADVRFADVDALHRKITVAGKTYRANRVVEVLRVMFKLAERWGMRSGTNPARHVERNPEVKRKRYLSGDELARLAAALAAHPNRQAAAVIRMALLSGARIGEVLSMRWDAVSEEGIWTKPASTTKQKADHVVPLSAPARQVLAELSVAGPFVFPGEGRTGHVVDITGSWRAICEAAGIADLRIHDLRHSFASQLASSGASLPLIGALLGHSSPATTARYAHLFQDPQRAAVERVGAVIDNAGKEAPPPTSISKGALS